MNERQAVHWTGHPFIDAGLAALAVAAHVQRLEELTPERLRLASEELKRVLLSDQALGIGVNRAFARTAMSQIFPNSELVNPSNWKGETNEEKAQRVRQMVQEALENNLQRAQQCLRNDRKGTDEICSSCGERRPTDAMVTVRKADVPLLAGIVNFYPAFAFGVRICGLCALAVRFLPMSVMRTGVYNRLWFLHTQALEIGATVAQIYGWQHFNSAIAANQALDFYSAWETAGDAGTVLYLLCELLERHGDQVRTACQNPLPTTAYIFSNDNRSGYVNSLPIPNELMRFLAKLQGRSMSAFRRFWHELLQVPSNLTGKELKARVRFVQSIAQKILNASSLVADSLDHDVPKLRGGWVGHRLYLQEVVGMASIKLAILERLGTTIAQSDESKRLTNELRTAQWNELYGVLLNYVRRGWLTHEEFYTLLPPNSYSAASEARDVLLAVIYEWLYCQSQGEESPTITEEALPSPDETLTRLQQIGKRLIEQLPNLSRWTGRLRTARNPERIRGTYLNAIERGAMSFSDFVFLAPLGDVQRLWLLRDYLLAFLFDEARDILSVEERVITDQT